MGEQIKKLSVNVGTDEEFQCYGGERKMYKNSIRERRN